jgi:hypothetical protein
MNILKISLAVAIAAPVAFSCGTAMAAPTAGEAQTAATQPAMQISAENQKHVDALTKAYFKVHQLLVAEKFDGITQNMQTVHDHAKALAQSTNATLAKDASAVADAAAQSPKDLDAARESFKKVSATVFDLLKAAPPSATVAKTVYQMHCPMADADWLQTSTDVANPYLNKDMSDCGVVQETIQGTSK